MARPIRVGILGHVGNENLGDESIIAAVIQNVRRHWPDAEINGFTLVPEDTEERHGIRSFPIRAGTRHLAVASTNSTEESPDPQQPTEASLLSRTKELVKRIPILSTAARGVVETVELLPEIAREVGFLRESRRRIEGLDLLIFAGSHQLNDFVGGAWAYPYTVLKWARLASRAGAKVVFLSLGAGPIETRLGRRFLRRALQLASYRSYRDESGKQVVDTLQGFETDRVVPDLAFSLDSPVVAREPARSGERTVVGINPLPLYADYWYITDQAKYEAYVGKLARFADWLVERDCEVRFIPTQLKVDPAVIDDVRARMTTNGRPEYEKCIFQPEICSLEDLRSELAGLDLMVATRYHGILLSLALQKPVLALAYHDKSRDLMNWLGQGDYVIEGDTFTVEALIERFPSLERERESIAKALGQQLLGFRSAVRAQYDEVFQLVELGSETATIR